MNTKSKGIVCEIRKDEDMPVDAEGNRADIIMDPSSTISRMNTARLYEAYANSTSRVVKRKVTDLLKGKLGNLSGKELVNKATDKLLVEAFDYCLRYLKIYDNEQYSAYMAVSKKMDKVKEILAEVVDKEFYVYIPIDNEKNITQITAELKNSEFAPIKDHIKYVINGKEKISEDKISITPMYIFMLNKIADTWLSTASSKVNHFGIPIGLSKMNKHKVPWTDNPTKIMSETEGRLFAGYGGRVALAELKDRANSMETHKHVYHNILTSGVPTNIEKVVNREVIPYGGDDSLNIVESIFKSGGCEIGFVKSEKEI